MQLCYYVQLDIASYKCMLRLCCDCVWMHMLNSKDVLLEMTLFRMSCKILLFLFCRLGVGTYLIGHMPGSQHIQIKKTTQAERWAISTTPFIFSQTAQLHKKFDNWLYQVLRSTSIFEVLYAILIHKCLLFLWLLFQRCVWPASCLPVYWNGLESANIIRIVLASNQSKYHTSISQQVFPCSMYFWA